MSAPSRARRAIGAALTVVAALALAACSGGGTTTEADTLPGVSAGTTAPVVTAPPTTAAVATAPPTTAAPTTTSTTTTTTTTTLPPPTAPPTTASPVQPDGTISLSAIPTGQEVEIGRSVQGRPIHVIRRGTPGGTRVLVIGAIHGNEEAGMQIVDHLRDLPVPDGVDLFLVPAMNPDGVANDDRQNANGVDLNRNFPTRWGPIAQHGDWQYAGTGPASEPETQAMVALGDAVRPDLTLWYHQDLFRINPASGRDGQLREMYASLTGLPIVEVTGGTYTGTASQWSRSVASDDGVGFTVELGEALTDDEARTHANAVLVVAAEV